MDRIYELGLKYENTSLAIHQRKEFIRLYNIGICDIVAHCYREKVDALDLGMREVKLRDLFYYLDQVQRVTTLLFTGG